MKPLNAALEAFGTTVFSTMSALCEKYDAINLGQGFPDQDGPEDVRGVASNALLKGPNQYPPMTGLPMLRQSVAENNYRFYGIEVEWQTETLVTSGATEALTASLLGLLNPGDEVVIIEPAYDCYLPIIRLAGAVPRFIRLSPPDWRLPIQELRRIVGQKTKAIVLNSPMNPTGKVFSYSELNEISEILVDNDCYAICDEVYEHLIFDGAKHIPLMRLPGMAERTVRVGSAGKTFSLTGWKVGYLSGPASMIAAIARAHQYITFTTPPNLQMAVAYGLQKDNTYFEGLAAGMQAKRDALVSGLESIGFSVSPVGGTYFAVADIRSVGFEGTDDEFCQMITRQARVGAIPLSAFYEEAGPKNFVRFCFCKREEILAEAVDRLDRFFSLERGKGSA